MNPKNYYYIIERKKDNSNYYINKYSIILDIEGLKKIKEGLINNCSHIIHKKYETTKEPNYYDTAHIKNYHKKKLAIISYNDFFHPNEINYLVEYDYYQHSKLVRMIEVLLMGNTSIISSLLEDDLLKSPTIKDIKVSKEVLKDEINKLIEKGQYEKIKSIISEKRKEIFIQEHEIFSLELVYLAQIKKCIKMQLIDQIEIKEFNRINNFFKELDFSKNTSKNLTKILKLNNKESNQ